MGTIKIFLTFLQDQIENNKQYFAMIDYVKEYLAKKFEVSKNSIEILSLYGVTVATNGITLATNFIENKELFNIGYSLELMSHCSHFVFFKRYFGDMMTNDIKILSNIWEEYKDSETIEIYELD